MAGNKKPQIPEAPVRKAIPPHLLGAMSQADHLKLKTTPHQSLVEFRKGTASKTDWFNVTFRILATLHIARTAYEAVTVQPLEQGYAVCQEVLKRHNASGATSMQVLPEELAEMVACVQAADEIQHQVSRFLQVKSYKKAFDEMKRYK